jgi:hypothetical protein
MNLLFISNTHTLSLPNDSLNNAIHYISEYHRRINRKPWRHHLVVVSTVIYLKKKRKEKRY